LQLSEFEQRDFLPIDQQQLLTEWNLHPINLLPDGGMSQPDGIILVGEGKRGEHREKHFSQIAPLEV
jgi:hypothetical protein